MIYNIREIYEKL